MVGAVVLRALCWFALAMIWSVFLPCDVTAADRIIDQPPHDLLTLKKDAATLKIVPLELKRRVPLREQDRGESLVVRLLKRPEQRYQVQWRDIDRVQLFEELVLAEAAELTAEGDFDTAYEYYRFIEQRSADFPGLAAARHQCMYREAEHWLRQGKYANSLVVLNELYQRASRFSGLKEMSGRVVDRIVEEYLAKGQHVAARELLDSLAVKYPNHDVVKNRRKQLRELARQVYDSARTAADVGKLREAHERTRAALQIWPDLEAAKELAAELSRKYPVVRVGVREPWNGAQATSVATWAQRRCAPLVDCNLFFPQSFSAEGGKYASRIVASKRDGCQTVLTVKPGVHWPGSDRPLSSVDVARQLIFRSAAMAPLRHDLLTMHVDTIHVVDATSLEIVWNTERPLWQTMLQMPIRRGTERSHRMESQACLGSYESIQEKDGDWRFMLREDAFGANARQPREISEMTVADTLAALRALRTHEIHVYDRIVPWDISKTRAYDDVRLVPYAAPTVHMLIPNPNSPALARGVVRRALSLALDRQRILRDDLGDGKTMAGAVLSGPFPEGYACDDSIKARERDARLAAGLLNGPFDKLTDRTITLVYAPDPVARRAARAMQMQWKLDGVGVEVVLAESSRSDVANWDLAAGPGQPWDLWYIEWNAMEPLVAAPRLLGRGSVIGRADPMLQAMVDDLCNATTWDLACAKLHELHRYVDRTQTVIPLWQIDEFAVVHQDLEGVGGKPVTLYQNVDQWHVKLEK